MFAQRAELGGAAALVIEIDGTYLLGSPHLILGRLYAKLPGIHGGDIDKAIEYYEKALAVSDNNLLAHRFLAEVLLEEGRPDEARVHLEKVLELPVEEEWEPEARLERDRARALLEDL